MIINVVIFKFAQLICITKLHNTKLILTMDRQLLEQDFQTVQKYITTMFSSLPLIIYPCDETQIMEQTIKYGKKIIELSEKFTSKYRKEHLVDRIDIQQKIRQIYLLVRSTKLKTKNQDVYGSQNYSLEDMVYFIHETLKKQANYANDHDIRSSFTQSNSRPIYGQQSSINQASRNNHNGQTELIRLNFQQNQNVPVTHMLENSKKTQNFAKKKRSTTNKSNKKGLNEMDAKTALTLRNIFQEQQDQMQKIFKKVSKIAFSSPQLNLQTIQQKLVFNRNQSKRDDQADSLNFTNFIRQSVNDNIQSLKNVEKAIEILDEHFERNRKLEGYAQGKFSLYLDQINKRQQVFSYTVSKLLEDIGQLREQVNVNNLPVAALTTLDNLEEIGNKFYTLYPSHTIIKDLKVEKLSHQLEKSGFQNQGVQVSIGKSEKALNRQLSQSRRNLLQLYRVSTRINQFIQRFEKSTKYKKNIQLKQIQKFLQSLKQSLPKKDKSIPTTVREQAVSYHEQLRSLLQSHEKNQKQLSDQYTKKSKKSQKRNQQLQKIIEQLANNLDKEKQGRQIEKRKYSKKLEAEKEENRKLLALNNKLQSSVKQLSKQLERLKIQIKTQYQKFSVSQKQFQKDRISLSEAASSAKSKLIETQRQLEQQMIKFEEQKQIYHNKIIILETKEEHLMEQQIRLKQQLEAMIDDNSKLQQQIRELSDIYQEKIKQLEYVIDNIKQLEQELKIRDNQNGELRKQNKSITNKLTNQGNIHQIFQKQNKRLGQQLESAKKQVQKFRGIAVLNENDIATLKQEIQKVRNAYLEADEQAQQYKQFIGSIQRDKQKLKKDNRDIKQQIQLLSEKNNELELQNERVDRQINSNKDQINLKNRENNNITRDIEETKKQLTKNRKQCGELREINMKQETQVRHLRQQLQKRVEAESMESGKRKLELEATKVELRRKNQQIEKQKSSYDQKIEILTAKNKQMSQFISQKQLLAKITNSHLSQ